MVFLVPVKVESPSKAAAAMKVLVASLSLVKAPVVVMVVVAAPSTSRPVVVVAAVLAVMVMAALEAVEMVVKIVMSKSAQKFALSPASLL